MQLTGDIKRLKRQMIAAIFMIVVSFVALLSTTYAWLISNGKVNGTTSTISAVSDDTVLQIVEGLTPDRGSGSTIVAVEGHPITPSSTDNTFTWFIPQQWVDSLTKVQTYKQLELTERDEYGVIDGSYKVGGKDYYAYNVKTFTVYTLKDTGKADVYLDADAEGGAIVVTRLVDGVQVPVTDKVAACLRVGIVIDDELKFVYAPVEPTGHGNDVYSINNDLTGWTVVNDETSTKTASYEHISGTDIADWAINRIDGSKYYDIATAGSHKIAEDVDSSGVKFQIYLWIEGTDADCNGANISGDESEYSVTVHLAGLAK